MNLSSTLTFLVAFAVQVVIGWVIPNGTANGIYSVQVFDNGTEHHVLLSDAINFTVPAEAPLQHSARFVVARNTRSTGGTASGGEDDGNGDWRLACYKQEGPKYISPDETDRANAGLDQQCGDGATIGNGLDYYSIVGCTVAYACNMRGYPGWSLTCTAAERRHTSDLITGECGRYMPGSATQRRPPPSAKEAMIDALRRRRFELKYGYEAYCTSWGHDFCGRGVDGHNG